MIKGCSESQSTSLRDFSTNYCNLRNLWCGAEDGCEVVTNSFTVLEHGHHPSIGAAHDFSACNTQPTSLIQENQHDQFQMSQEMLAGHAVQYLRVHNHSTIAEVNPDCNFFEAADLARRVPDKCCNIHRWPAGSGAVQTPPDARTNPFADDGKQWNCYVQERVAVPGSYTRNFFGCEDGVIQLNEGCAPTGTHMGNGYPMSAALAATKSEDGTPTSCGCDELSYRGEGCYVAMTSYIKGLGSDITANFVSVKGECAAA